MSDLVFDDKLSVGIDEIDEDHQKLFDLFNLLKRSVEEGKASGEQAEILEELISFTTWHFSHEEQLMRQYGYDQAADHETEHWNLIGSAMQLQQKFLDSGTIMADNHIEFLEGWLTNHIRGTDMKLGSYLSGMMSNSSEPDKAG